MRKWYFLILIVLYFLNAQSQNTAFRGKILMIGDSALFQNNSTSLFQRIAVNSGDSFYIDKILLKDSVCGSLLADSALLNKLYSQWDFVILQENTRTMITTEYHSMMDKLGRIKDKLRENGNCCRLIFTQNWGLKSGDSSLCKLYSMCCSFKEMNSSLESYTGMITRDIMNYAPVAEAWQETLEYDSTLELYQQNGYYPSNEGSYLVANTLYGVVKYLMDRFIPSKTYHYGLSAATESVISKITKNNVETTKDFWQNIITSKNIGLSYNVENGTGDFFRLEVMDASNGIPGSQGGVTYKWEIWKNDSLIGTSNSTVTNYFIIDSNVADYTFCLKSYPPYDSCDYYTECKELKQFYPYYHRGNIYSIACYFYNDKNSNCNKDSGEEILNIPATYIPSDNSYTYFSYSNSDTLQLRLIKDIYSINLLRDSVFIPKCSNAKLVSDSAHENKVQAIPVNVKGTAAGKDLDVGILQTSAWSPGYEGSLGIYAENLGIKNAWAYVTLTIPDSLSFSYSEQTPSYIGAKKIQWKLFLTGGNSIFINTVFNISASRYSYKDSVEFFVVCDSLIGDIDTSDNKAMVRIHLDGSYDPNFKEVENPKAIDENKPAIYTIHFQNTGTAPARNIVVVDTLETDCPIESVEILASSHNFSIVLNKGILYFTFENINLPDSGTSNDGSMGFVKFAVHRNYATKACDIIPNRASIFFDFNTPVMTNTCEIQRQWPLGVNKPKNQDAFLLIPNPGNEYLTIRRSKEFQGEETFYLYNIHGKLILSQAITGQEETIAIPQKLDPGIYIIKSSKGQNQKWVLMR